MSFSGTYTGNSIANFFLGLPHYMGYGEGFSGTVGQRNEALGAFVQDDWRITSHLTINYGLRWQLFTPIYEVDNRMPNFGDTAARLSWVRSDGRLQGVDMYGSIRPPCRFPGRANSEPAEFRPSAVRASSRWT